MGVSAGKSRQQPPSDLSRCNGALKKNLGEHEVHAWVIQLNI